jgi:hypothetical protein
MPVNINRVAAVLLGHVKEIALLCLHALLNWNCGNRYLHHGDATPSAAHSEGNHTRAMLLQPRG